MLVRQGIRRECANGAAVKNKANLQEGKPQAAESRRGTDRAKRSQFTSSPDGVLVGTSRITPYGVTTNAGVDCAKRTQFPLRGCVRGGTGILPVGFCGIGILPMIHGLEAHATTNRRRGCLTGSGGGYRLSAQRGSALGDTCNRYGKGKSWAKEFSQGHFCLQSWRCSWWPVLRAGPRRRGLRTGGT